MSEDKKKYKAENFNKTMSSIPYRTDYGESNNPFTPKQPNQ